MTEAPAMVAGAGRFTTRLMEVTGGRILGKEGAEGLYAVAVRGPVALGLAVKITDGGERCRDGVVLELLRQAGCLAAAELAELAAFYRPERRNWRDLLVGEVVPEVELVEVG
jgi:L-asparaginase II